MRRALLRFLLFGWLGLLIEVHFTAAFQLLDGNWNMHGRTSPWMVLVYGLLGLVIGPVGGWLRARGLSLPERALAYMVGIFVVEYFSGLAFNAVGLVLWDYSDKAFNLHGQITLLYAPFWFALGLVLEWLYRLIDRVAGVLLQPPPAAAS